MRWTLCGMMLVALPAAARPLPPQRPPTASLAPVSESPEQRLARARQAYLNNDFRGTVDSVRDLLYPDVKLRAEDDVQSAHRLLGLSYYLSHEEGQAEREFTTLLALRPDFALDPVVDPPQVIAFLDRLRTDQRQRLDTIERRHREEAAAAAREEDRRRKEEEDRRVHDAEERARRALKPVIIEKHSKAVSYVPFGAGQFQNGEPRKGAAFLGTQIVLGATSLALYFAALGRNIQTEARYGNYKPPAQYDTTLAISYASAAAAGLFWIDVAWGVIDAVRHFQPQVVKSSPPSRPRASLHPFALPTGGGLSVGGAF